jgi:glutamine cyclotransferase
MNLYKSYTLLLVLFTLLLIGCNGNESEVDKPTELPTLPSVKLLAPFNQEHFTIGDRVEVKVQFTNLDDVTNVQLFVNDTLHTEIFDMKDQSIMINSEQAKVGHTPVYLKYFDKKGKEHRDSRTVVFFSDLKPGYKTVKIQNTFPHLTASFTQGLEFYKGILFEGTGQYNQSVLAEVDLKSGIHVRSKRMDSNFFGEGITILRDTIYQLTWQSHTCLIYDMDFNEIGRFTYEGEGWGLCNDGNSIIMSNGSDKIVWRNSKTFEIEKEIYVFTPTESVVNLNEMEMIDNRLFANIWQDNKIVEIDTATGKVLNFVDCNSVIVDGMGVGADVLNGIAFDESNGKTYLTGKRWSKLYEVVFE